MNKRRRKTRQRRAATTVRKIYTKHHQGPYVCLGCNEPIVNGNHWFHSAKCMDQWANPERDYLVCDYAMQ